MLLEKHYISAVHLAASLQLQLFTVFFFTFFYDFTIECCVSEFHIAFPSETGSSVYLYINLDGPDKSQYNTNTIQRGVTHQHAAAWSGHICSLLLLGVNLGISNKITVRIQYRLIRKPASFSGNEDRCSDPSAFTQAEMSNLPTCKGYCSAAITLPASGSDYRLPTHHFPHPLASSDCGAVTQLRLLSARPLNPHVAIQKKLFYFSVSN